MSSIITLLLYGSIKKRLLAFIITLITLTCTAQNPSVSGSVFDTSKNPVPFADVVLKQQVQDSTFVKTSFTDEHGHFEILNVNAGEYLLTISTIGYENYTTKITINKNLVLPDIVLQNRAKELDDVVINQKRPIVRRKIDRIEFDVENSIISSDNAWQIVKKTPGVNVVGDGISIRGSSGILVTINDKKVYLTGTELKNLLENTNGDDIKSIEVITTPPAKYEAQGSAVLNIKMKKNVGGGYKGSVSGAYVQSMYPKGVVATNHYFKNKKLTVFGGYMFGSGHYYGESRGEVRYTNPEDNTIGSVWKSNEKSHYRATQQNSYNISAEYAIDTLNTVSVGFNGFSSLKSTALIDTPTAIYDGNGRLDSLYTSHNHRDYPQKNSTVTGSYEHIFNKDHKVIFASDYTRHYFNQEQDITAGISLAGEAPHTQQDIWSNDTRRISLFSAQADYNGKEGETSFEAGMRYGNVSAKNIFDYDSTINGVPASSPGLSNNFLYDENILAGYIGAEREFGKWGFKAGLRGEHTRLEGNSVTTQEVNRQDYFKLFPSAYALYKASDNHQIGLSYGKRIIRPQYSALNPFRSYNTPYSYSTGDPRLQPAITHNFSLQYTLKSKYNFDLFYRYEKDPSSEVIYQDYTTNTIITKYTNISRNIASGLEFNTNVQFFEWWEAGTMSTIGYQENTFQGADESMQVISQWTLYTSANSRFTLNKRKDILAEFDFFYMSPAVQGAFKLSDISSLSLSFKKVFLNENAEAGILLSDVYRGERQTITTQYGNQYSRYNNYGDSQSFRIFFRYRFGNQKLGEGKTRESTDEQKRL